MLHKPIEEITEEDLLALVSEGRQEDTQLEFKQTLPGNSDDQKREFLKDVSAMANTQGGDIIYGIREDRTNPDEAGKAAEVVGITGAAADTTKLWMLELLNSSIEERLIAVRVRDIRLTTGGFALIVRVPRSWNAPHVVRHRNHWRFYARNSAGVYAMNLTDLRSAFLLSDTISQRLTDFREKRLQEILFEHRHEIAPDTDWSDSQSAEMTRKSLLVIHLQPFDSVKPGHVVDVATALRFGPDKLKLCDDHDGDRRLNFDGLLVKDEHEFLQLYRNGVTEEVNSLALGPPIDTTRRTPDLIDTAQLDRAIFKGVGRRLTLLKSLGIVSPVLVSVSMIGVRGCRLNVRRLIYQGDVVAFDENRPSTHSIDRDSIFLTGLIVENLADLPLEGFREVSIGRQDDESFYAVQSLLRPYCDTIWNAVGFLRSEYFNAEGKWRNGIARD